MCLESERKEEGETKENPLREAFPLMQQVDLHCKYYAKFNFHEGELPLPFSTLKDRFLSLVQDDCKKGRSHPNAGRPFLGSCKNNRSLGAAAAQQREDAESAEQGGGGFGDGGDFQFHATQLLVPGRAARCFNIHSDAQMGELWESVRGHSADARPVVIGAAAGNSDFRAGHINVGEIHAIRGALEREEGQHVGRIASYLANIAYDSRVEVREVITGCRRVRDVAKTTAGGIGDGTGDSVSIQVTVPWRFGGIDVDIWSGDSAGNCNVEVSAGDGHPTTDRAINGRRSVFGNGVEDGRCRGGTEGHPRADHDCEY